MQAAWMGFWQAVRHWKPGSGDFMAFARRCAENEARTQARRLRRAPQTVPLDPEWDTPADGPGESHEADVDGILAHLTPLEQVAVLSRALGIPRRKAAVRLGLTEKALENAMRRARVKIRDRMRCDDAGFLAQPGVISLMERRGKEGDETMRMVLSDLKRMWQDDRGVTIENLAWYVLVGLATFAIGFGINAGLRKMGGAARGDTEAVQNSRGEITVGETTPAAGTHGLTGAVVGD